MSGKTTCATMEDMLIMDPPLAFMLSIPTLIQLKTPLTFTL